MTRRHWAVNDRRWIEYDDQRWHQRDEGESHYSAYFSLGFFSLKKDGHQPPTYSHRKSLAASGSNGEKKKDGRLINHVAFSSPHDASLAAVAHRASFSFLNIFPPSGFTLGLSTEIFSFLIPFYFAYCFIFFSLTFLIEHWRESFGGVCARSLFLLLLFELATTSCTCWYWVTNKQEQQTSSC